MTNFRLSPADRGITMVEYGVYTIGRVPDNSVSEVKDLFLDLLQEIITRDEHDEMSRLYTRLAQVQRELHDELLVVILRRVAPGRCRYCPV